MKNENKTTVENRTSDYICIDCGLPFLTTAQKEKSSVTTFHKGKCGICQEQKSVTSIRHYNYGKRPKDTIISRAINGISINGPEYLLDDDGEYMRFRGKREAIKFLQENGYEEWSLSDFDDNFNFEEIDAL